jgi:hypothetical protein
MRIRQTLTFTLLLFVVLSLPGAQEARAWGQTGHRVVGYIAQSFLNKKAKKRLQKLLKTEDLALCSTWMDEIRSDERYDHTHDWHWVTIPDGMRYEDAEKNPNGDVIERIEFIVSALKSDTLSQDREVEYLKMLVHLVGDLHQPLHVGTGKDRGGNDVKVKWMWRSSNLHRVWDSEMIDDKQLSYTELAHALLLQVNKTQVESWLQGDVRSWAMECVALRPQVYDTGDTEKMGYLYLYRNWPTVEVQLLKAGIRLAYLLNEIYG